jgi:hypothetical protein
VNATPQFWRLAGWALILLVIFGGVTMCSLVAHVEHFSIGPN